MTTETRFGIIGEGDAVMQAYQDLGAAQGADVAAVMADSVALRRELEAMLSTHIVETVGEVCQDPDVEAVYIALPAGPREEAIRLALESGKHALVAGPWDAPLAEGISLCAVAQQQGVALGISAPWAVSGGHLAARDLARAGLLGEIVAWSDDLLRPQPVADTLRQALRPLSLFSWLTELQAEEVHALEAPSGGGLHLLAMILRYGNGALGSLQVGRGIPGGPGMHPQGLRVVGTEGQLDLTDEPMVYRTRSSEGAPAHTWRQVRHTGPRGDRAQAMAQFAARVRAGQEPPYACQDALEPLRIMDAAQRSLAEGRTAQVVR
jgi:predicted dehydrogenase